MSIWNYPSSTQAVKEPWVFVGSPDGCGRRRMRSNCVFCKSRMVTARHYVYAEYCPTCGWWKMCLVWRKPGELYSMGTETICHAILQEFSLQDISTPIEEVRSFLLAKYKARFSMHPRLFEETVAAVFRDIGYTAQVSAYQGDGGIDVVLSGTEKQQIGVQVKRYRNRIAVNQIREFTGALLLRGYTRGIFVTTSSFQSGAAKTASLSKTRGIAIELIDAPRFLGMLRIGNVGGELTQEEWIARASQSAQLVVSSVLFH